MTDTTVTVSEDDEKPDETAEQTIDAVSATAHDSGVAESAANHANDAATDAETAATDSENAAVASAQAAVVSAEAAMESQDAVNEFRTLVGELTNTLREVLNGRDEQPTVIEQEAPAPDVPPARTHFLQKKWFKKG